MEFTLLLIKILQFAKGILQIGSGALFSMISHIQEWDGSRKIMAEKQWKAWERCSWCHSGYCTSELGLYWLIQGRTNCLCRYSPSWASGDAMTGGPAFPHKRVATIPLPEWPSLLPALHHISSFASGRCPQQLAVAGWSVKSYSETAFPYTARICPYSWDSKIWFCLYCWESLIFPWGLFLQSSEWDYYYITIQSGLANVIISY